MGAPGSGCVCKEDSTLSLTTNAAADAAHVKAPMAPQVDLTSETLLDHILASLSDNKAEDVVQIDLRGKSSMGDYMVVASGRSTRQVSALADKLVTSLKAEMGLASRVEGKDTGDWVLIDTGDIIVHLFRPEVREFYQIEKMWLPMGSQPEQA